MATLLLVNHLRPRPPPCSLSLVLLLLLLLTVFTQHSSCSRPLRQPAPGGPPLDNGGVAAVQTKVVALPTETAVSREELAAKYGQLLLNRKPRGGRPPPSGPSKGTNDIKN